MHSLHWMRLLTSLVCGFLLGPRTLPAQPVETVRGLVAKEDIPAGTVLARPEAHFRPARFVKGEEPRGILQDVAGLRGRVVARRLAEDQPVKEKDLLPEVPAERVPPGLAAVRVRLGYGVGLSAGDRARARITPAGAGGAGKEVQLEDLRVLAVGWVPADVPGFSGGTSFVTLAVPPARAGELTAAQEQGRLVLIPQRPPPPLNPIRQRPFPIRGIDR